MSDKKKKLGEVKIESLDSMIEDINQEISMNDVMVSDMTYLEAHASVYGFTSGCSDSCGSSTICC